MFIFKKWSQFRCVFLFIVLHIDGTRAKKRDTLIRNAIKGRISICSNNLLEVNLHVGNTLLSPGMKYVYYNRCESNLDENNFLNLLHWLLPISPNGKRRHLIPPDSRLTITFSFVKCTTELCPHIIQLGSDVINDIIDCFFVFFIWTRNPPHSQESFHKWFRKLALPDSFLLYVSRVSD
jgi:hypothetical protein